MEVALEFVAWAFGAGGEEGDVVAVDGETAGETAHGTRRTAVAGFETGDDLGDLHWRRQARVLR